MKKVIVLALLIFSGTANAIVIYSLDADGAQTGQVATTWEAYSGSPAGGTVVNDLGGGTDWEVFVGANDFGDGEFDNQTSGIYGAGTTVTGYSGYEVMFDFDGFTWDSYNTTQPVNPGASNGYWDLFAMNINTDGMHYWDMVNGGSGTLSDPLLSTDPAGNVVVDADGTGPLAGVTWGWGGLDYAAGFFEEEHGVFSISLMGNPDDIFYISAVLDTATGPNADSGYPSWGGYNAPGKVPEPEGGETQDPPGGGDDGPTPVPEPSIIFLFGMGLLGLGFARRRMRS